MRPRLVLRGSVRRPSFHLPAVENRNHIVKNVQSLPSTVIPSSCDGFGMKAATTHAHKNGCSMTIDANVFKSRPS